MKENRSYFWAFTLIAAGVLWILINIGAIPASNLWVLMYVWPVVLIGWGVGLILGAFWPYARMMMSMAVVGFAVLAIVYAPYFDRTFPRPGFMGAGSGMVSTEERQVEAFESVSVSFPAEVIIEQGEGVSLSLEGDDRVLSNLRTNVRHGVLYIEARRNFWSWYMVPVQPVTIEITVKDLENLDFTSAGSILVEGLEAESLEVDISGVGSLALVDLEVAELDCRLSGAGELEASGSADHLELQISGVGSFDGQGFSADTADVQLSGVGDAVLWIKDELKANVSGVGSVRYYGTPDVTQHVSGVGTVHRLEDRD
ncbi:MAG: DUF2807 domain-containing protein [Anaerolineales bacterium]|nr:DUF2807 domain-containing protein [Anaerolineales bacterium]